MPKITIAICNLIQQLAVLAAGIYLLMHEHPRWGGMMFVMVVIYFMLGDFQEKDGRQ